MDESRGFLKAIVDAETDQILGAAVLGIEGGEIMSMLEVAIMGKLPYTVLRDGIFAHPTLAESFNKLFDELSGGGIPRSPRRTLGGVAMLIPEQSRARR